MAYADSETGLTIKQRIWMQQPGVPHPWRFAGDIVDAQGNRVGHVLRDVNFEEGYAQHRRFELDKEWQGKGFGSRYYRQLEEAYIEAGIKEIHLRANLDVGGYAWARMGFDFLTDSDRRDVVNDLASRWGWYRRDDPRYGTTFEEVVDTFRWMPPWELATITAPDGERVGKKALIGSNWSGVKSLDPNSPGRLAGEIYFEEKDKHG